MNPRHPTNRSFRPQADAFGWFVKGARTVYDSLAPARNVAMTLGGLLLVVLTLVYIHYCWRSVTLIDPIPVPPGFASYGVSPVTAQQQFNEDLLSILESASSVMPTEIHQNIVDAGQDDLHLEIPGTGLSVDDFVKVAKAWYHRDGRITAQIIREGKALHLSGRVIRPGGESHPFDAVSSTGNLQEVIALGAQAAMSEYNPYVLASSILDKAQKDCLSNNAPCQYTDAANAFWNVLRSDSVDDTEHLRKWAYLGLSKIAENKLDYLTEIEHARRALALDPHFSWARYNWGVALDSMGCHAEAREKFSAVIRDRYSFAAGHNALGSQYLSIAKTLPQPVVSNRLKIPPEENPARLAQLEFEAATSLDPRYGEAFMNLGDALQIQGRQQDALTQLRNAVSVDIGNAGNAYKQIASIEKQMGTEAMARNADQAAIASDWENRWCRGSIQSGDAVSHGCGSGFTSVAVQASLHNVRDWPKVSFPEADCKQYASEGGP